MAYIDMTTKGLGMTHVHITLDMQLYIIACLIQWSNALRWQSIVLRPGMMHTLMSFIGAIGVTMLCTGLEDLVRAAYGGIAGIMNGKAWPKAMRAFRMVVAALMPVYRKATRVTLPLRRFSNQQERTQPVDCGLTVSSFLPCWHTSS